MSDKNPMARPGAVFSEVMKTVEERKRTMPERSYVATLLRGGANGILCKLAEETGEVIKAAREQDRAQQVHELCDLFFHAMVLMAHQKISFEAIEGELAKRHGISGIDEKASRKKKE